MSHPPGYSDSLPLYLHRARPTRLDTSPWLVATWQRTFGAVIAQFCRCPGWHPARLRRAEPGSACHLPGPWDQGVATTYGPPAPPSWPVMSPGWRVEWPSGSATRASRPWMPTGGEQNRLVAREGCCRFGCHKQAGVRPGACGERVRGVSASALRAAAPRLLFAPGGAAARDAAPG